MTHPDLTSPFALLKREGNHQVELLRGPVIEARTLSDLPDQEMLILMPFRQVHERGFEHIDDGTPLAPCSYAPVRRCLSNAPWTLCRKMKSSCATAGSTSTTMPTPETVRRVVSNDIETGLGSDFVIKRTLRGEVDDWSPTKAASLFRRLLATEQGAYWTFGCARVLARW
ncbi:hypothetical protein GCM10010178_89540 [Lentzea flava]|uniref:Uncharacterized protein n=1 Tax=Lentzea flava TaxID=103732 RepID=A0ABQ2VIL5_9PSEU|nr:hypothetical protein [Lentzea flava]GGU85475.1 hypothetical protein GCM10010178_89540 [Lentzea flava]